jgi:hypothetical protein
MSAEELFYNHTHTDVSTPPPPPLGLGVGVGVVVELEACLRLIQRASEELLTHLQMRGKKGTNLMLPVLNAAR